MKKETKFYVVLLVCVVVAYMFFVFIGMSDKEAMADPLSSPPIEVLSLSSFESICLEKYGGGIDIETADMDGDGDPDIVVFLKGSPIVTSPVLYIIENKIPQVRLLRQSQ